MSTPPKLPIPNMDLVNPSNLPPSLNNTDSSMSIPAIPGAPGQSSGNFKFLIYSLSKYMP